MRISTIIETDQSLGRFDVLSRLCRLHLSLPTLDELTELRTTSVFRLGIGAPEFPAGLRLIGNYFGIIFSRYVWNFFPLVHGTAICTLISIIHFFRVKFLNTARHFDPGVDSLVGDSSLMKNYRFFLLCGMIRWGNAYAHCSSAEWYLFVSWAVIKSAIIISDGCPKYKEPTSLPGVVKRRDSVSLLSNKKNHIIVERDCCFPSYVIFFQYPYVSFLILSFLYSIYIAFLSHDRDWRSTLN